MELNILQTLSLLIIFLVIGYALQRNVKVLKDNYVPAPVIGGLLFSIILAITKSSFNLKLDFSALPIFVAGFFLSIGLRIDFATFKKNLKLQLLLYLEAYYLLYNFLPLLELLEAYTMHLTTLCVINNRL